MDSTDAPLTDEEYVTEKGGICPFCRTESAATAGSADIDGTSILVPCWCMVCHATWDDTYVMTGYIGNR